MKHLKMLGLAAIAALGTMAFVGTGTASATTLSTDAAGNTKYALGTGFILSLEPITSTLLETTSGGEVATCSRSTVSGSISTATGTWVSGSIGILTWAECNQTTDTINSGSLEIMQTTGDAGTVVGKGTNVTLGVFGVSCTYGTGEGTTLGTISGGEAPELSINAILSRSAGNILLCPSTGRWTANYIVTSPHAIHVVA
jgi:hypothetical protein